MVLLEGPQPLAVLVQSPVEPGAKTFGLVFQFFVVVKEREGMPVDAIDSVAVGLDRCLMRYGLANGEFIPLPAEAGRRRRT